MNYENNIDLTILSDSIQAIKTQIAKTIVGQHKMIDYLLTALFAEGHVLIEGVPGVAKTLTAKTLAKTISVDFSRIQFTPDLMPSDVIGTSIYNPKTSDFVFRKGPIFSNLVLIDEINRAPAKTQAALFEVMEERQITYDGTTYSLDKPFMVLATQNPIEQEGTYRLPEAQLDRFLFKIIAEYPSLSEEISILEVHHTNKTYEKLSETIADLNQQKIINIQQKIKQITIKDNLIAFIAQISTATRNSKSIYLGASPRASVALLNASKAYAAINGRDFVTPEDILELAPSVLRHRLILTPEKEMEGVSTDKVIEQLLQNLEIPR